MKDAKLYCVLRPGDILYIPEDPPRFTASEDSLGNWYLMVPKGGSEPIERGPVTIFNNGRGSLIFDHSRVD